MRLQRLRPWMPIACILIGYVVSLSRVVDHELVWDDVPEILDNPAFDRPLAEGLTLTQVERGAPELAALETLQFTYDSYRPVTFASYWLDIAIWGRSPRALHGTNVVLGALAILLAFVVVRRWIGPPLAWLPVALFALHPAQIETIAYVSARGDLLAGLFALGATYAVLRGADAVSTQRALVWMALAMLAFAASLLSKETYLALPVALGVIACARPLARWWIPAALLVVAIAYLPFRAAMIDVQEAPAMLAALRGLPPLIVEASRIFLLPFDLSIERKLHTSTAIGSLVLAVAAVLAVWSWRRARSSGSSWTSGVLALSGLCWFVVLLAPSSIVVARTETVADRYLYLPLLGVAVAITVAIARVLGHGRDRRTVRHGVIAAGVLWGAIVLAVAWMQVPVWRDNASLYRHALAMERTSSGAHYRVALLEIQKERWDLAVPLLERAIELDPENARALNDLGVYYLRHQRAGDAERLLGRAVVANPAHFKAWMNLGLAQLARHDRAAGCASIARALVIHPQYAAAQRAHARSCAP